MTATAATEVVARVHRLGTRWVNWYLLEEEGQVTVVDAGVPGYWDQLEPALSNLGLGLDNVAALVLTHAHSDHTGVAGRLHERGTAVYLHPDDNELMRTGKEPWEREGGTASMLRNLGRPGAWRFFVHMARNGALKPPRVEGAMPIADGDQLDVPGRPRVLHTPGHTPGHCVFHFERHGALFVGDLLCTWNALTGRLGPQIMPAAFNVSSDESLGALEKIESLAVDVLLAGHGEPWRDGAGAAVARAREAGKS